MKDAARAEARVIRARLTPAEIVECSARIATRVETMDVFRRAKTVACYLALPREVQTAPLLVACRRAGQRVCVPAYDDRAGCYRLAWLTVNDVLTPGRWQVPEPVEPGWVQQPAAVEVVMVPGLLFDPTGRRIGHGGGGYDRLLEGLSAYKIALAFAAQLLARVPVAAHDVLMDAVVTENEIYFRAQRVARG